MKKTSIKKISAVAFLIFIVGAACVVPFQKLYQFCCIMPFQQVYKSGLLDYDFLEAAYFEYGDRGLILSSVNYDNCMKSETLSLSSLTIEDSCDECCGTTPLNSEQILNILKKCNENPIFWLDAHYSGGITEKTNKSNYS